MAAYTNKKWKKEGGYVTDSQSILLNLTNNYNKIATNNYFGGIYCNSGRGPSFGDCDLLTLAPLLGKDNFRSNVNGDGFGIEGKVGEINPLTGDVIIKLDGHLPHSRSTALEIEVWHIEK